MKHTPAPWIIYGSIIYADGKEVIAQVHYNGRSTAPLKEPDDIANANLIAAAPELLEACEGMFSVIETLACYVDDPKGILMRSGGYKIAENARHAISKAKGEK